MKMLSVTRISIATISFLLVAFLFSCKKENSQNSNSNTEDEVVASASESTEVEASFDDVADVSMVAADEEDAASTSGRFNASQRYLPIFSELRSLIGDCATINVYPNDSTYPKTITINFKDTCVGVDGKTRKGKIVLYLTGPIRRSGSVMTVTFVDFYLNRAHLEGTKIVTNLSENHTIKFSVQVTGGKVTWPNGRGFKYESFKYKEQIEGMDTPAVRDNVFEITGESKTEFNNGLVIKFNTTDPLNKKVVCPWISDGTLKITINNRIFKLDYGFPSNGGCDNKALLTWNNGNNQRVIFLP
jgi:hypothetical protein